MANPIDVFNEVRKLHFPSGEYIVVGSGILSAKGIRPSYDLDIVVTPELFEKCKADGWELKPWTREGKQGKEWLKRDGVELMLEMGFDDETFGAKALIKDGEIVEGISFLSLPQLIKFKREYGRQKDFDDIALIEKWLGDNN